jgi:hypothetical protein
MTRGAIDSSVNRCQRLLLACFPKSGSTFLASILAGLPGFQKVSLVPDYGRREQELSLELLLTAQRSYGHFVAQHHLRCSQETRRLIALFSLQPIVLVRNLQDVVVSIRDHIQHGGTVIAQAYIPPDAPQWNNQRIELFIADMILPWYFNFYASWTDYPDRVQLTYEELVADPASAVRRLRNELDLVATDAEVQTAVETACLQPGSTRFNVGLCGRGKELPVGVVSRIQELASYYRFLDLSPLGLSSTQQG